MGRSYEQISLRERVEIEILRRRYFEQVVPQMSLALPEDERAQVRMAFEAEFTRLG